MKKWITVLEMMSRYKAQYLFPMVGAAMLLGLLDVCLAPILNNLMDAAVSQRFAPLLTAVIIAAVAVLSASILVPFLQYAYTTATRLAVNRVREQAMTQAVFGPASLTRHSSETLSVLTNDLAVYEELLSETAVRFFTQIFLAIFATALIAYYDVRLAIFIVLLAFAGSRVYNRLAEKMGEQANLAMAGTAQFMTTFANLANGLSIVKIFKLENVFRENFQVQNAGTVHAGTKTAEYRGKMDAFNGLLKGIFFVTVLLVGLAMVQQEQLTFGELAAMMQLTGIITVFFYQFGSALSAIAQSYAAVARILPLLQIDLEAKNTGFRTVKKDNMKKDVTGANLAEGAEDSEGSKDTEGSKDSEGSEDSEGSKDSKDSEGSKDSEDSEDSEGSEGSKDSEDSEGSTLSVVADASETMAALALHHHEDNLDMLTMQEAINTPLALDVQGVSIKMGEKIILRRCSFQVEKNSLTVLVGESGSGKTSLFRTFLGLLDAVEGNVVIMGKSAATMQRDEIRRYFAYMSQASWLFELSVAENIRQGRLEASDEEVENAAKEAGAHPFILSLENGYETKVGVGGEKLSGGQRARIALARAIVSEAPILLLDEPTAAFDASLEQEMLVMLQKLKKTRTVLMTTHRENPLRFADAVISLNACTYEAQAIRLG